MTKSGFSGDGLAVTLHGYESAHRGGWHYGDHVETLRGNGAHAG